MWIAVLAGIVIGVVVWKFVLSPVALDCQAARQGPDGVAVDVCRREYDRTRAPVTGAQLAESLRRTGDREGAKALANDLLATTARGNALRVLGKIAETEDRIDEAVKLLQEARQVHRTQGSQNELARDDQALARIQNGREMYADALQLLDECIVLARATVDMQLEGYCRLTAAKVLTSVGYFELAHQELDRAGEHMSGDRDLAELWFQRGNLEQELVRGPLHRAHSELAVLAFDRSLDFATRARHTQLLPHLHMNLAFSLAELARTDDADRHLATAAELDRDGRNAKQRTQLAARIAYRRGNLDLAFSLNERAYQAIEDHDEQIDVCVMQARIALALNNVADAVRWARRGVEAAEKVRATQTLSELRPWVLASRREPFEVLFTALARAGSTNDAVMAFDQWQGRTLLDEMARPNRDPSLGLSSTANRIQSLGRWLPAVSKAPLMTSDSRAVIDALGKIDLVALAIAEGQLWRVTASRGRVVIDNLGEYAKLKDRLDTFMMRPTDPTLGNDLGLVLLPSAVVRTTDEPLYVVLDAPLAAFQFVALRHGGQPLIAARPVIRTPRLPVLAPCGPRIAIGNALVLADAAGDLPAARRESSRVASMFGTTPLVGAAATSTALFAAKSDPLLHIAVHAEVDSGGGSLKLHDRTVSSPEISANKLGPAVVVLSACSTASSGDPELAGALSTAFLAGGSQRVVATLRPVSDAGALELTSQFYDARGAEDPARVLARIQAELSRSQNQEWPNFAVFGKEACTPLSGS